LPKVMSNIKGIIVLVIVLGVFGGIGFVGYSSFKLLLKGNSARRSSDLVAKGNVQYQGHYCLGHSAGRVWRDWVCGLFVFFQLQRSL